MCVATGFCAAGVATGFVELLLYVKPAGVYWCSCFLCSYWLIYCMLLNLMSGGPVHAAGGVCSVCLLFCFIFLFLSFLVPLVGLVSHLMLFALPSLLMLRKVILSLGFSNPNFLLKMHTL